MHHALREAAIQLLFTKNTIPDIKENGEAYCTCPGSFRLTRVHGETVWQGMSQIFSRTNNKHIFLLFSAEYRNRSQTFVTIFRRYNVNIESRQFIAKFADSLVSVNARKSVKSLG
jgi:hypothetical protein